MLENIADVCMNEDVVLQQSSGDGKSYAFNIKTGDCFELNECSYFMLDLLQRICDAGKILNEIVAQYKVSYEEASDDFVKLIKDCTELGILHKRRL